MPPGDLFRVFERGGRNIGTQFPEIGLPNPPGQIQRLEEPGRPDIRQSNRGPGTGLRVAIPVLNIHKTRLNDPFMWFMGTNDQPGDYRTFGLRRLPRRLRQRPRAAPFRPLRRVRPRRADADQADPDHPQGRARPPAPPRLHPRDPDRQCMICHMHQPNIFLNTYPRLHDVGL